MPHRDTTVFQSGFERSQPFSIGDLVMFQQNETKSQNFKPK